jgi:hypothetical protein
MFTDLTQFNNHVKELKKLARGNAPSKAPGNYSETDIITGRDGCSWRTHRVIYYPENDIERYELVWIKC